MLQLYGLVRTAGLFRESHDMLIEISHRDSRVIFTTKKQQHPWGLLVHWLMVKLFWVFFGEKDKFITKKDISL